MNELRAGGPRPPWPAGAAWLEGRYCPIEDARISVLDLGVTRSDCTYDVVHVWQGRFYRLDAHLDRFAASMARLRLDPGQDRAAMEAILHGCVRHAGLRDAFVSMTCTRGRMPPGSRDLRTAQSNLYCFAVPFVWISSPEQQGTGSRMWISDLTRIPPQSVDPTVKNYHWLDLDLALLDAYDHDADQVVLRDLSGAITEGPGYNVFAHVNGRWLTPGHGTLAGITRRSLIELAREAGQRVDEGCLTADDLLRADEVLVTSTAGGIMPVTAVNGAPVGAGVPGPLTRDLKDRYWGPSPGPPLLHPRPLRVTGLALIRSRRPERRQHPGRGGWPSNPGPERSRPAVTPGQNAAGTRRVISLLPLRPQQAQLSPAAGPGPPCNRRDVTTRRLHAYQSHIATVPEPPGRGPVCGAWSTGDTWDLRWHLTRRLGGDAGGQQPAQSSIRFVNNVTIVT